MGLRPRKHPRISAPSHQALASPLAMPNHLAMIQQGAVDPPRNRSHLRPRVLLGSKYLDRRSSALERAVHLAREVTFDASCQRVRILRVAHESRLPLDDLLL